ncbi:hypothetical protein [Endozoicomonas sp. Mp262]|uniref:hypothetical protein n=1 Tax=Endozoicomonas sp. Mp262 TaxID=2919499 RepID=UPI0021D97438
MASHQHENEAIRISDLEERLITDEDGSYRDQLMSELFDKMVELKALRDQSLSPEEFNKVESLILAIAAAGETVGKTWKKHHKNKAVDPQD